MRKKEKVFLGLAISGGVVAAAYITLTVAVIVWSNTGTFFGRKDASRTIKECVVSPSQEYMAVAVEKDDGSGYGCTDVLIYRYNGEVIDDIYDLDYQDRDSHRAYCGKLGLETEIKWLGGDTLRYRKEDGYAQTDIDEDIDKWLR